MTDFLRRMIARRPVFEAEGASGGVATATEPTAAEPTASPAPVAPSAGAKWFEADSFSAEERSWLTAKGMAQDDPAKALQMAIKGHRAAEQRIGKGIDNIIDKPAKGQAYAEWANANRAALGLPDKEDAYTVTPPEDWPKDAPWNSDLEAKARKIAFENGGSPELHKAYVGLFAEYTKSMLDAADRGGEVAREKMMADLRRDLGDQTEATITGAKQAAQFFAEKAGLDAQAIESIGMVLSEKIGDAGTIRFMAAIREAMGEDRAVAMGQGSQQLTATPADARAELAKLQSKGGEYYEATISRNLPELERLKPKIAMLTKIAAGK